MKTHLFKTFAIIGISLLFSAHSYGQTKEETITWLKEKLGNYVSGNNISNVRQLSIDECTIVFEYVYKGVSRYTNTLPTSIRKILADGYFDYTSAVVLDKRESGPGYDEEFPYREDEKFSCLSVLFIENREDNIRERVEKALKHLATFCPKKTKTF